MGLSCSKTECFNSRLTENSLLRLSRRNSRGSKGNSNSNILKWKSKIYTIISPDYCQHLSQWPLFYHSFQKYIESVDERLSSTWFNDFLLCSETLEYLAQLSSKSCKTLTLKSQTQTLLGSTQSVKIFNFISESPPKRVDGFFENAHVSSKGNTEAKMLNKNQGMLVLALKNRVKSAPVPCDNQATRNREINLFETFHKMWQTKKTENCYNFSMTDIETMNSCMMPKILNKSYKTDIKNSEFNSTAKKELQKNLMCRLESPYHIVNRLVYEFSKTFQQVYGNCVEFLSNSEYLEQHQELFAEVTKVLKHFVRCVRDFLYWMYSGLFVQFRKALKDEDQKLTCIIEDLVYELIFINESSLITDIAYAHSRSQKLIKTAKLKENLIKKKGDLLESYAEELAQNPLFLMKNTNSPYNSVIQKLLTLKDVSNPYRKLEIVSSLGDEIINCLKNFYNNEPTLMAKIRRSFSSDLKVPIVLYCVVQSQNEQLLLELSFIKTFISGNYLYNNQEYLTLKGCLKYLLNETEKEG